MSTVALRRYVAPAATMVGLAFGATLASLPSPDDVAATLPPRPVGSAIATLQPDHGPAAGGNTVTITGERFSIGGQILFGDQVAEVQSRTDTQAIVKAPAGLSGTTVQVRVDNPSYYLTTTKPYTYDGHTRREVRPAPEFGTPAGGTKVIIGGAGIDFAGTKSVTFGGKPAAIISSDTSQVVVTSPPGAPSSRVRIEVQTADGNFEGTLGSQFAYNANAYPPEITKLSPPTAYAGYGQVTVEGIALDEVVEVKVGGKASTGAFNSDGNIIFSVPALAPGKYDVQVTTRAGTSVDTPADDLTVIPLPQAPEVDSVTPGVVGDLNLTSITLRGKNLGGVETVKVWNYESDLTHVSDTELRVNFRYPVPVGVYPITAFSPGSQSVNRDGDATDDLEVVETPDAATPGRMNVTPGQVEPDTTGYATVKMSVADSGILLRRVGGVKVGSGANWRDGWIDPVEEPYTSVTVHLPAGQRGVSETIRLYRYTGPYDLKQINSDEDRITWAPVREEPTPTPTPAPTVTPVPESTPSPEQVTAQSFGVKGSATFKTLTTGSLPFTGTLDATFGAPSGKVAGTLGLAPASGSLTALGFLPVVAKVNLAPTEPVAGTLKSGRLSVTAKVRIKLPSVKTLGIELAGGANCQAKQISSIALTSTQPTFTPASGGSIAGTFAISDLTGCGFLTGLVSPLTKGSGNAIALQLSPKKETEVPA